MDDPINSKDQEDNNQELEKTQSEGETETSGTEEPSSIKNIKKSFFVNNNRDLNYERQFSAKKSSNKITFLLIGLLLLIVLTGGFFLRFKLKSLVRSLQPAPLPTSLVTLQPTPTPNPLIRSAWNLEVLNGTGESGLAKKIASKIQALGYQVVKTDNADKSNYSQTQILVKKELIDRVDLVIADLKDTIKIASVAGELKEGTASARIIIGKDSI